MSVFLRTSVIAEWHARESRLFLVARQNFHKHLSHVSLFFSAVSFAFHSLHAYQRERPATCDRAILTQAFRRTLALLFYVNIKVKANIISDNRSKTEECSFSLVACFSIFCKNLRDLHENRQIKYIRRTICQR